MKLSVVIPCWNAARTISIQLEALAQQTYAEPWELVIADNGSTDNTLEVVQQYRDRFSHLQIVDASAQRSAAYARNIGVQASHGEFILFCDADDEVDSGWIAAMAKALDQYDFVAGRLEYHKLNEAWLWGRHSRGQEEGLIPYPHSPHLPYAAAANLGLKRQIYQVAGPWDERFRHAQDTEYCWRIQLAGFPLHFVPDAIVHYRLRHTLSALYRQGRGWAEHHILLRKCYEQQLPRFLTLKLIVWLLRHIPKAPSSIYNKTALAEWFWELGWRVGLVKGCFKYLPH